MHGQLYRRHTNATALSSSPVVSALGSKSDNWDSSPGRGKVLRRVGKKKMRTPLLGLAKSIYHFFILITCLLDTVLILKGEILS